MADAKSAPVEEAGTDTTVKEDTQGKATASNAGSNHDEPASFDSAQVRAFAKTIGVTTPLSDAQVKEGVIFLKKYMAKKAYNMPGGIVS
jgi:hypothetical protein